MNNYEKIFTVEEIQILKDFIEMIDSEGQVFPKCKDNIKKMVLRPNQTPKSDVSLDKKD